MHIQMSNYRCGNLSLCTIRVFQGFQAWSPWGIQPVSRVGMYVPWTSTSTERVDCENLGRNLAATERASLHRHPLRSTLNNPHPRNQDEANRLSQAVGPGLGFHGDAPEFSCSCLCVPSLQLTMRRVVRVGESTSASARRRGCQFEADSYQTQTISFGMCLSCCTQGQASLHCPWGQPR